MLADKWRVRRSSCHLDGSERTIIIVSFILLKGRTNRKRIILAPCAKTEVVRSVGIRLNMAGRMITRYLSTSKRRLNPYHFIVAVVFVWQAVLLVIRLVCNYVAKKRRPAAIRFPPEIHGVHSLKCYESKKQKQSKSSLPLFFSRGLESVQRSQTSFSTLHDPILLAGVIHLHPET